MSGAQLCTWLRNQVQTAKTPVIICSSAPDEELAEVARSVGADGYVSKQAGPEALPAKLHALCEEIIF
jgi:DNA-binding response OmpR family regulator